MLFHPGSINNNTMVFKEEIRFLEKSRDLVVNEIFNNQGHRKDPNRFELLKRWIFKTNSFDGPDASPDIAQGRVEFLMKSWNDQYFRPFDDSFSSIKYLGDNPKITFLIRLSCSVPGSITVSFRESLLSMKIFHTRYTVGNAGRIIDSNHIEHPSIDSFSKWFSDLKYGKEMRLEMKSVSTGQYLVF